MSREKTECRAVISRIVEDRCGAADEAAAQFDGRKKPDKLAI
jgi:hypothetical protein